MTKLKDRRSSLKKGQPLGHRERKNHQRAKFEVNPVSRKLQEIMGHFADALSLVIVCHRSLAAQSSAGVGDEEETLRRAIRLLKDVYNEIDEASFATTEIQRSPSGSPTRAQSPDMTGEIMLLSDFSHISVRQCYPNSGSTTERVQDGRFNVEDCSEMEQFEIPEGL